MGNSICKVNTIFRIIKDYGVFAKNHSGISFVFNNYSPLSNPKFHINFAIGNNFCNLQYDPIIIRLKATL